MIDAATEMFLERGWVPTTMADVAVAAGLTRQTVYQQFDGKLALLDACIVRALVGDEQHRIQERPDFRRLGEGTREERAQAAARWLREAHERSAAIQAVLDQAAVTDPDAAARRREREQARWKAVGTATELVLGRAPSAEEIDAMWTLASRRCWLDLVADRGWSGDRWQQWFHRQLLAALAD